MDLDCVSRKFSSGKSTTATPADLSPDTGMLVSLSNLLWAPRSSTSVYDETSDATTSDSEQGSSSGQSANTDEELNRGLHDLSVKSSGKGISSDLRVDSEVYGDDVSVDVDEEPITENCSLRGFGQEGVANSYDSSRECDNESENDDCVFDDLCDFKVPDSGFVDGGEPEYAFEDQVVDVSGAATFSCDGGFFLQDDVSVLLIISGQ